MSPSDLPEKAVLPCFPLPLARAALPGSQRTINVREQRYVKMYQYMLQRGINRIAVPKTINDGTTTQLAEACVVFELTEMQDAPPRSPCRFICKHTVVDPVRIRAVLNPEVFADASTFLQVECEPMIDEDTGVDCTGDEAALVRTLEDVVRLSKESGLVLRRFEWTRGAAGGMALVNHGRLPTISEESLVMADVSRQGFWGLVSLWQGYCERRIIAVRQLRDRETQALSRGDESSPSMVERVQAARTEAMVEMETNLGNLIQRLLQTGSYPARLALLREAASTEVARLGAAAALREAIGGEY